MKSVAVVTGASAVDADCVLQAVCTPTRYVGPLGSRTPVELALSVMHEYSQVQR